MRKTIITLTASAILALGIFAASGQAPTQPRGVLSVLHTGQPVTLKETNGRYEVGVIENGPTLLGHRVVEAGNDFLIVQDIAGVSETRIPIFSIKAVVTLKIAK